MSDELTGLRARIDLLERDNMLLVEENAKLKSDLEKSLCILRSWEGMNHVLVSKLTNVLENLISNQEHTSEAVQEIQDNHQITAQAVIAAEDGTYYVKEFQPNEKRSEAQAEPLDLNNLFMSIDQLLKRKASEEQGE